jgi:formate dehydrogenase major subunit
MACPGGCIDGAGQPVPENSRELTNRQNIIYNIDKGEKLRKSQENPDIISLYDDFFEKPNSPLAHKLLHTHYHDRRTKEHVGNREESTYKQKVVEVCVDKHCAAKGSQEILDNLKLFVKENQLEGFLRVKSQMCKGHCKDEGVFVTVDKRKVDVEKLKDINSFVGEILKDMK